MDVKLIWTKLNLIIEINVYKTFEKIQLYLIAFKYSYLILNIYTTADKDQIIINYINIILKTLCLISLNYQIKNLLGCTTKSIWNYSKIMKTIHSIQNYDYYTIFNTNWLIFIYWKC